MRWLPCVLLVACTSQSAPRPSTRTVGFESGEDVIATIHSARDVETACETSRHSLTTLRDAMLAPELDGTKTIRAVGALDRAALIAIQTIDMLAQLHPDEGVRNASHACEATLTAWVVEATAAATPRVAALHDLAGPEHSYAERFLATSFLSGPTLSPENRAKLSAALAREQELMGAMIETLSAPIPPIVVPASRLAGLPPDELAKRPADASGNVSLVPKRDMTAITTYATDRSLGRELGRAMRAAKAANLPRIAEILQVRHTIAQLLGCGAYAECQARVRMVKTSARVREFNDTMLKALASLDAPYRAALQLGPGERPDEWDQRKFEFAVRQRTGFGSPAPWLSYLEPIGTLERVLAYIGQTTGLTFVPATVPTWSPDVRVFDVQRKGARIGRFYFDLFARPGKVDNAGSSWPFVPHTFGDRTTPVSATIAIAVSDPTHLSSGTALAVLVHEIGHAIDFLFETQSQIAPPEADFFDVPSQLFELWAHDLAFLQAVGRKGNEPLPREGAESIAADMAWDGWDMIRFMTELAILDQQFHGDPVPTDLTALYAEADERIYPTRTDRESHPEVMLFMPTVVYAGNAHALPWGRAIAADLAGELDGYRSRAGWDRLFDEVLMGDAPAEARIERFLGRPWNLDRLTPLLLPPLPR